MISTAAVQLLHEYTGRGATKAKTLINDDAGHDPAGGHAHEGGASSSTTAGRTAFWSSATTTSSRCARTSSQSSNGNLIARIAPELVASPALSRAQWPNAPSARSEWRLKCPYRVPLGGASQSVA